MHNGTILKSGVSVTIKHIKVSKTYSTRCNLVFPVVIFWCLRLAVNRQFEVEYYVTSRFRCEGQAFIQYPIVYRSLRNKTIDHAEAYFLGKKSRWHP